MKNKTARILVCAALLLACASLAACSAAPWAAAMSDISSAVADAESEALDDASEARAIDEEAAKTRAELEAEESRQRAEIEAEESALAEMEVEASRVQAETEAQLEAHNKLMQAQLQARADVERAKAAALKDAGLTEAEVTFTKAIEERDDGKRYIGVEFYTGDALYEYEIDMSAKCAVLEKSVERFRVDDAQATPAGTIGVARAKEIAAAHVGESLDALVFSKAKLENDDGRAVYELEFFHGSTEYEYTIDAATGDILESESKSELRIENG